MHRLIYLISLCIPYVVTVKQAGTSPSTDINVEEDCGMPMINKGTVVNVNYRYDLDSITPLDTKFPSGTILITRCYDIGKYQLINGEERVCSDGSWTGSPATCNRSDNRFLFRKYGSYNQLPRQVAPNSSYIMNVAEGAKLAVDCRVKHDAELRFEPFTGSTQLTVHGDRAFFSSNKIYYVIDSREHSGIYTCWDVDDQGAPPIEVEVRVVDPIYCPVPLKTIEQITYSNIVDNNKFPLNTKLTYSCPPQYRLIGETQLRCLYDGQWDFEFPRCNSLFCDSPPLDIDHGTVIGNGTAVNTEIGIYCDAGFQIPGTEEGMLKSVCTGGEWVPALPSDCVKTTPVCINLPEEIANGVVSTDYTNERSVTIICNTNAVIAGTKDTRITIRCVDGEWDHAFPSSCIEPTCPLPPLTLWNGIVRRQNNTVLLICDDGYYIPGTSDVELVVTCENEEWDDDFPVGCADSPDQSEIDSVSFSESVSIQFCKHRTCRREPSRECRKRRAVPVIGSVIEAETVGDADIRVSIDVRKWIKTPLNWQESSTLTLVVKDAKQGDCYCPNVFPFNANTLIYLRHDDNGNIKLAKRSYIEQLDDDVDQSPYC